MIANIQILMQSRERDLRFSSKRKSRHGLVCFARSPATITRRDETKTEEESERVEGNNERRQTAVLFVSPDARDDQEPSIRKSTPV